MKVSIIHSGTIEGVHASVPSYDYEEVSPGELDNRLYVLHNWISQTANPYRSVSPIGYRGSLVPSNPHSVWLYEAPGFRVVDLKAEEDYDEDAETVIGGRIASAVVIPSWTPEGVFQFVSLRAPNDDMARVVIDAARATFDRYVPLAVPMTHESLEWAPGFGATIHPAGHLFQI